MPTAKQFWFCELRHTVIHLLPKIPNGLNPLLFGSYFSINASYDGVPLIGSKSGSNLTVAKLSNPFSNAVCRALTALSNSFSCA